MKLRDVTGPMPPDELDVRVITSAGTEVRVKAHLLSTADDDLRVFRGTLEPNGRLARFHVIAAFPASSWLGWVIEQGPTKNSPGIGYRVAEGPAYDETSSPA